MLEARVHHDQNVRNIEYKESTPSISFRQKSTNVGGRGTQDWNQNPSALDCFIVGKTI
jgi:hypothetical protein